MNFNSWVKSNELYRDAIKPFTDGRLQEKLTSTDGRLSKKSASCVRHMTEWIKEGTSFSNPKMAF